jgi:hypothetical protein
VFTLLSLLRLDHNVFPLTSLVILEVEVDLLERPRGVKVDPEVFVIKKRLNRVVRCLIDRVFSTCRRLNEERLLNLSITLLEEHPAVKSLVAEFVFALEIWLIIVDSDSFVCGQGLSLILSSLHLVVIFGVVRDLLLDLEVLNRNDS